MGKTPCVASTFQFVFTAGGVFVVYAGYAVVQEWIFRIPNIREYGAFLTMVEFTIRALLCWLQFWLQSTLNKRRVQPTAPFRCYILVGFTSAATMVFSNCSLFYLNYPTQMMFKSCKLIPVMIGGILIQSKRYHKLEYISVFCMTLGLIWFTKVDKTLNTQFNLIGILYICSALVFDAFLGNFQEKILKQYRMTQAELTTYSYSFGAWALFVIVSADGSIIQGYRALRGAAPLSLELILGLSVLGFLGINLVLLLIRRNGALVSVTVTTLRKVISTVISFLTFAKPFSIEYLYAGIVLLSGVSLNIYSKNTKHCNSFLWVLFSRTCLKYIKPCFKFKKEDLSKFEESMLKV
ncbi:adenosine 3'-phospho 5'-phosphosulfate transporter 2-like [Convolutriloba macropyga]|uniref:adenosine 3'-phospho 5'-phosphosulfate transporter 2-like n=1 Tax=Convolutriloba macropyga TaxID=536237 RepID=UPI003F5203CE